MQKPEARYSKNRTVHLLLLMALVIAPFSAFSFQVLPKVSDVDRKLAGLGGNWRIDPLAQFAISGALQMIKSPVHEAITLSAVGCNPTAGEEKGCVVLEAVQTNRILLYGFVGQMICRLHWIKTILQRFQVVMLA